jgi:hypothetical protein
MIFINCLERSCSRQLYPKSSLTPNFINPPPLSNFYCFRAMMTYNNYGWRALPFHLLILNSCIGDWGYNDPGHDSVHQKTLVRQNHIQNHKVSYDANLNWFTDRNFRPNFVRTRSSHFYRRRHSATKKFPYRPSGRHVSWKSIKASLGWTLKTSSLCLIFIGIIDHMLRYLSSTIHLHSLYQTAKFSVQKSNSDCFHA